MKGKGLTSLVFLMLLLNIMPGLISAQEQHMKTSPFLYKLNDSYDFVIISPELFCDQLQPLIVHKEEFGIQTLLVSLEEIYSGSYFPIHGRDEPEQIKYFIKNAVENWDVQYVMLVGTKEIMPVRYVSLHSCAFQSKWNFLKPSLFNCNNPGFISDLYYADLYDQNGTFCSWDSDDNNMFGEMTFYRIIDEVDLNPDISVGRVLCQSNDDVEIMVNKIINYENNAFGKDWFNNFILCGGDTHPYTWEEILLSTILANITGEKYRVAWEGEYMCDEAAKTLDSFNHFKYYSSGFFGLRAKSLTVNNINDAINQGAGFLLFSMHGSPNLMATFPPFQKSRSIMLPYPSGYNQSNIQKLTNEEKLPVAVFSACSCGDFDETANPIAWEFVQHEHGGSIASFALTTEGNIWMTTLYTESLSGFTTMSVFESYNDGIDIIGDIWKETIGRYLRDDIAWSVNENSVLSDETGKPIVFENYLALEEWILFGDPTLKIGGYE